MVSRLALFLEGEGIMKQYENVLQSNERKSIFHHIIASFKDITIIILIVAVVLSTYVAFTAHPDNLTEPIVITGNISLLNLIKLFAKRYLI